MSDRKWTPEQEDAIAARNTGIIVSAAAGSGKTSVLVERLVRILADTEDQTPADRLVVVTFTNDAAAQMKQRLSDALSERIEKDPQNWWLCRQQTLLQAAKISTIHSFCFDLIRENIRSLDVSAGFRVLDNTEDGLLIKKAVDNAFEELYKDSPEMMNTLADFFSGSARNDDALEEIVTQLYDFLVSIPFYEDWLKNHADFYSAGFDSSTDPLAGEYLDRLRISCKSLLKKAEYANKMFEDNIGPSKAISSDIEHFESIVDRLEKNTGWDEKLAKDDEYKFARFDAPRKLEAAEAVIKDKVKDLRDSYKKEYEKLFKSICSETDIRDDYKIHAEILTSLMKAMEVFVRELNALKAEKNALSFSDAEQLAVRLLAVKDENGCIVKTPLAKELEDYYSIIMIDEFQDANNNQDLIFKMLSKGGTADKGGTNLFAVGDVKQSIYRFRRADPQLFRDALKKSSDYTRENFSGTNARILLNKNFRSSRDVIDFVNYCFRQLMSEAVGEVDYTTAEELVCGADYPDKDRSTEFIIVPAEEAAVSDDDGEDEDELDLGAAACEARAAAQKIRSCLMSRRTVSQGISVSLCGTRKILTYM